jgi:peptidoglycan hydrolase-like protein with peptidoglycan-binding domain
MHYEFMGTPNDAKLQTIRARIELGGGASQEADVNVVRFNDRGPRVKRAQIVLQAAGYKAGLGELLPEWGTDGHYGEETADAVNVLAKRAGLDPEGDVGMDVLVLDYCRNWLSA